MKKYLTPEEILKSKEEKGGIVYDDELMDIHEKIPNINEEKVSKKQNIESENKIDKRILQTGWKNLPLNLLPSKGIFYPKDSRIAIRPANVNEIRHFSSIDEEDQISISEKFNYILSRCAVIEFSERGIVDYDEIIQEDRFYIIMAIRDLTFIKGENRIMLVPHIKCKNLSGCEFSDGFELRTGCLDFFHIDENIMKYYSYTNLRFEFILNGMEDNNYIIMYIPTIKTRKIIDEFLEKMTKEKKFVDDAFKKILPYILPNNKRITIDYIYQVFRKADEWTKEEFSLYFVLSQKLKIGTKLNASIECPNCKDKLEARILFRNGIKSIFVISDILDKLL